MFNWEAGSKSISSKWIIIGRTLSKVSILPNRNDAWKVEIQNYSKAQSPKDSVAISLISLPRVRLTQRIAHDSYYQAEIL